MASDTSRNDEPRFFGYALQKILSCRESNPFGRDAALSRHDIAQYPDGLFPGRERGYRVPENKESDSAQTTTEISLRERTLTRGSASYCCEGLNSLLIDSVALRGRCS